MKNLITQESKTMSSREIAELTGSDHSNVLKTIRYLISQGIVFGNETTYQNKQNYQHYPEFFLDYRNTMVVVSGYSAELRSIIIDRWMELENQCEKNTAQEIALPKDYLSALKALVESEESKQLALQQLELAAPKVDFYDRVADVGNLMTAGVVGKKVGMSAQALNNNLDLFKVYDKRQKGRVFNQWFIDKGLGEIKKTENGFNSSKFTNKGEQWIIEKLVSEGVI